MSLYLGNKMYFDNKVESTSVTTSVSLCNGRLCGGLLS